MNTGSVLFPSHSPVSSRPSSTVSTYDDHSNYSFSTDLSQRSSRPPSNGRLSYPHQPFPLNPSPRHYLYPPYAHAPPPPLRPSIMPPPPMFDDPAFSSDPRANPHFAMTSTEHFVPLNPSAANIQNTPLPSQDLYRHSRDGSARAQDVSQRHAHKITSSTPPRLQPRAESAYYPEDAFAFPSVPQPPPSMPKLSKHHRIRPDSHLRHNNPSLLPPYDYINDSSSNSSCSSSSHSTSSGASSVLLTPSSSPPAPRPSKLRARLRVVNPEDDDRPIPVFTQVTPPEYNHYDSKSALTHVLGGDRPPLIQNTSAPELRPPAAPATDVPPRPATVPVPPLPGSTVHANLPTKESAAASKLNNTPRPPAPEMHKQRSRKTSVAAPPKDLDRIDELDETDPLGYAWHHDGRFEAALNALKQGAFEGAKGDANSQDQTGKKSSRKKPSEPMNPNTTTFNVSPGEIFPTFVSQPQAAVQPLVPQQPQQFPQPIQRPSRQASQPASKTPPPSSQTPLRPSRSQSRLRDRAPQVPTQAQPVPSSLTPDAQKNAASRLDTNGPVISQQQQQQLPQAITVSQPQPTRMRPNSQYLTVPTTNPAGDGADEESELAYTLPSPARSPVPNALEQQQSQAQAQLYQQSQNPYFPTIPVQSQSSQQQQKHHHNRLRRHDRHDVPGSEPAGLAPAPPAGGQDYPALAPITPTPGSRVRFQDQHQQAGYDNFVPSDLQDPRYPVRRMPSPQPTAGLNQPFLQSQDENVNVMGNGNYRNPGLQRSTSAPHTTPRSQPSRLPPMQPMPEDFYANARSQERLDLQPQQQQIPRPDINLPPRHAAGNGNMKSGLMPSYLPKKLVMPTPLQPQLQQQPTQRPSGMGLYGDSSNSASSGSSGATADSYTMPNLNSNGNGRMFGHGQSLSVSVVNTKKAKEVPISQGRNLLRKRTTIAHAPTSHSPVSAPSATQGQGQGQGQTINLDDPLPLPGPGPLGPGMGKNGYVPSSNATAALFASTKGPVDRGTTPAPPPVPTPTPTPGPRPFAGNGNVNGVRFAEDITRRSMAMAMGPNVGIGFANGMGMSFADGMGIGGGAGVGPGVIGGEMNAKSSREKEKEDKLKAKELEKMRERENQKHTGRKLSKRR